MATICKVEIPFRDLMESSKSNAELVISLCDMGLQALAERDAAREELANLKAAQPEPAPVVGGVTEAMLDKLCVLLPQLRLRHYAKFDEWHCDARAAIRAQKRVDVEALREIAAGIGRHRTRGRAILRAIGDEPAEAPVAEPAAPAQEGPFWRRGVVVIKLDSDQVICKLDPDLTVDERNTFVRLLNLGVEAEKLRARVAELEEKLRISQTILGVSDKAHDAEKARADAAEAKLAALGENPIPRETVERWRDARSANFDVWQVLVQILAGREPGAAP